MDVMKISRICFSFKNSFTVEDSLNAGSSDGTFSFMGVCVIFSSSTEPDIQRFLLCLVLTRSSLF